MRKFLKKIFIYAIVVLLIGNIIGFSANYFLKKSSFYKSSFLVNNFNPIEKFDYFIVGSSRGLTTLNTTAIDDSLNIKGINLAVDDSDLKTQFLMIKHFFQSNFKSDYLVLVLDSNHFKETSIKLGSNDYRFVPFIERDYIKEHFKKYEDKTLNILSNSDINPFFAYSYYNLELFLPSVLSVFKPRIRNRFDEFGNYSYPYSEKKATILSSKSSNQIIKNLLLEDIDNYLKKNNCELIIYIAPYQTQNFIFKEVGYSMINHSGILNDNKYFYDTQHVNFIGRELSTNYFIDSFKSNISLR